MDKPKGNMDINKLSQLAEEKEEELREVKSLQLSVLQKDLTEKDKLLKLEKARFQCLKRDFEYNLAIIEQRDAELLRFEKIFVDLKESENLTNSDMSDLKITIEELRSKLGQSEKEKIELERYYGKRTSELQLQLNHSLAEKNRQIQQEKDEYLKFKGTAELRIQESDNEMEMQKRKLVIEFDDEMARKEKEFRSKVDEMDNVIHTKEITIKMMKKEVEMLRDGSSKVSEEKDDLADQIKELRKEVTKKDWEIQDVENMAEVKLNDIKHKLEVEEKEKDALKNEFNRVYINLDKTVKAKEEQLKALQQDAKQREDSLKNELEKLKNEVSKAENKLKQAVWDFNDRLKERDLKINGLETVLSELKGKTKIEHAILTQSIIARDVEIETLNSSLQNSVSKIGKLQAEFKQLKNEYDRLKEHENLVVQAKEELELQWQKKYEEASEDAEERYKKFIGGLQNKLSMSQEELKNYHTELSQRENLIKVLTRDRDIACSLLKRNGIDLNGTSSSFTEMVPKENVDSYIQQNEQLKNLISVMRKEIESIEERHRKEISQASLKYTNDLELEVRNLKADKRALENSVTDLQEQVHDARKQKKVTFFDDILVKEINEPRQKLIVKLKSAARQIQDLVLERDRLQSIGNRLRSEISDLRKEFRDVGTIEHTAELPKRSKVRQRSSLENLEDLHYQIAMKELKERPRAIGKDIEIELASSSEGSVSNIGGDHDKGTGELLEQIPSKDFEAADVTENYMDRISSTPSGKGHVGNLMNGKHVVNTTSSSNLSSLQDVWKILEEAESLASQTPRSSRVLKDSTNQHPTADKEQGKVQGVYQAAARVEGQQMVLKPKEEAKGIKLSKLAQGKYVPVKKTQKIRNYNVKGDH